MALSGPAARGVGLAAVSMFVGLALLAPSASADHNLGWANCWQAGLGGHEHTGLYCIDISPGNYCWFESPVGPLFGEQDPNDPEPEPRPEPNRDPGCSLYFRLCLVGSPQNMYIGVDAFARGHREEINGEVDEESRYSTHSYCKRYMTYVN